MSALWLADAEIDDLCAGLTNNAAKARHLNGMGLIVNRKPNGRPLVVRSHAEAVLSGLAQVTCQQPARDAPVAPDRDALVLLFGKKKAAV